MGQQGQEPAAAAISLLQRWWRAQNLVRSAMAQTIWKGMASVVDMWAQSSEESEEKQHGEVSGGSDASTG